ncbi:hypothetical protein ACO1O0_007750 [Amphichorda felina]
MASIYHAEDTAYYLFEWERSKNNNPLAQTAYENGKPTGLDTEGRQINTLKYPEGAMVATWGYYSWWKTSEKIRGEPIVSCSDGNKYLRGRKGCQTVANDLGVEWARISDLSAEDIAESNELALAAADEEDLDICLDLAASPPSKRNLSNMKKRWVRWAAEAPLARAEGCATTYTVNGDPLVPSTMTKTPLPAETQDGGEPEAPPTTQEPPEPTKPPEKPDCWMQNALPDQYTSAFCRCTQSGETKTLPLLTVESPQVDTQSCDYTAMPTKTENPVTEVTVTFTAGCNVCAGPGGIQNHDPEWCTPIPGCQPPRPTYALYLSDTAALLGTALNEDEGVGLSGSLIDKVKEHCPDDSDICDNEKFDVFDVPIIAGEGVEAMILEATIDDSYYNNTDSRDYMLYSAAAGLVNAALKTCSDVSYQDAADLGESGCGEGPIEKRHPRLPASLLDRDPDATDSSSLEQRIPPTDPDGTDPIMCSYATKMCTGPKVITNLLAAILGTQEDPFLNNLGLSFTLRKAHDGFDNPVAEFFCEAIVNGLALLAMRYMPKLPGFEAVSELEDLALEMVCGSE